MIMYVESTLQAIKHHCHNEKNTGLKIDLSSNNSYLLGSLWGLSEIKWGNLN